MFQIEEMKIRIKNKEHSRMVQRYLFSEGVYWRNGYDMIWGTEHLYLYVSGYGGKMVIVYGNSEEAFNGKKCKEYVLVDGVLKEKEMNEEMGNIVVFHNSKEEAKFHWDVLKKKGYEGGNPTEGMFYEQGYVRVTNGELGHGTMAFYYSSLAGSDHKVMEIKPFLVEAELPYIEYDGKKFQEAIDKLQEL